MSRINAELMLQALMECPPWARIRSRDGLPYVGPEHFCPRHNVTIIRNRFLIFLYIERENSAPPPQSWREPPSQLRLAHDCHLPDAHRRANSSLCRSAYPRWALQTRLDALSQALRGPRESTKSSPARHPLDEHESVRMTSGELLGIVRLTGWDLKNLQSRTLKLEVDATRPGRRLGNV